MRYSGFIGLAETSETTPGVWTPTITEKKVFGDVLQQSRRYDSGQQINEDLHLQNRLSVVYDSELLEKFATAKYITWNSSKWKISSIEIQPPRLVISLGGLYNE